VPDDAAGRALKIATELSGVVGELRKELGGIDAAAHRSRRIVRFVAAGLILDLALSAAFVYLYFGQARVSDRIHQSQLSACAIGNDFRHRQVALWDHVLAVSQPRPGETAAERKARLANLAAFRVYVAKQFRPVNCAKLYRK